MCLQLPLKLCRVRKAQVQAFALSRSKICPRLRHPPSLDIVRSGVKHSLAIGTLADTQGALLGLANEKRRVQALGRQVHHLRFGIVHRAQNCDRSGLERPALLGRAEVARGELEQALTQVIFKLRNPRRGHRWRNPQIAAGSGHAAQIIDTNKCAGVFETGHLIVFFDTA